MLLSQFNFRMNIFNIKPLAHVKEIQPQRAPSPLRRALKSLFSLRALWQKDFCKRSIDHEGNISGNRMAASMAHTANPLLRKCRMMLGHNELER